MLLTSPVTFSSTPVAVLYPMTAVAEPPQRSRINPLLDAVMTAGGDRIVRRRAVRRRPCARRTTDAGEPGSLHEEGVCGVVFARRHGEAARSERDAGAKKHNRERGEERSDFHTHSP